jgi:hypothetical protein
MRQYLCAVIIEGNIFALPIVKKSPVNFGGNGNNSFTGKQHVQN